MMDPEMHDLYVGEVKENSDTQNSDNDNDHDNDDGRRHEQLPSVEEYKADVGFTKRSSSSRDLLSRLSGHLRSSSSSSHHGRSRGGRSAPALEPSGLDADEAIIRFAIDIGADDDNDDVESMAGDENHQEQEDAALRAHIGYDPEKLASEKEVVKHLGTNGWKMVVIVGFVVMLAIIIGLSVGLTNRNNNKNNGDGSSHTSWHRDTDRFRRLTDYLVNSQISSSQDLSNTTSPQYFAAQWMAHQDGQQLTIPTSSSSTTATTTDAQNLVFIERYALAVFYYATGGPDWDHQLNFLSNAHVCAWYQDFVVNNDEEEDDLGLNNVLVMGIHGCKAVDDELVPFSLFVPHNNLVGALPEEVQHLDRIEVVMLDHNPGITGTLPRGFSGMMELRRLALQWCGLSGPLPTWLGEMPSLQYLGLGNNHFEGSVPSELAQLTALRLLGLDDNTLTANIEFFQNFPNLESLYLEDNMFTGTLSDALLFNWDSLQELDLSGNQLNGELPPNLFSHKMPLKVLDLHNNAFTGEWPSGTFDNNFELEFLALHENRIEGVLTTDDMTKLKALRHLDLSSNSFEGDFPDLGSMKQLEYVFLGNNAFSQGPVPNWMVELTNLRELSLVNSRLTGEIPEFLHYLSALEFLDLHANDLQGEIPSRIGFLNELKYLFLQNNRLSGNLPPHLINLTNLVVLLLEKNNFTGNADVICDDKVDFPDLLHFVADCGSEMQCSCCDICCDDSDRTCNAYDWEGNLDPIWEYGYQRERYAFDLGGITWIPENENGNK